VTALDQYFMALGFMGGAPLGAFAVLAVMEARNWLDNRKVRPLPPIVVPSRVVLPGDDTVPTGLPVLVGFDGQPVTWDAILSGTWDGVGEPRTPGAHRVPR
jgi:hypothetical protein